MPKQQTRTRGRKRSAVYSKPVDGRNKIVRSLGPVALTWAIAKSMPGASRGEILAACSEAGINPRTAAGQVQKFLQLERMDHEHTGTGTRRPLRRPIEVSVEPEVMRSRSGRTASASSRRTVNERHA